MQSEASLRDLFHAQVSALTEPHFLILYWTAQAEGRGLRYNLTNCFDDLKAAGITRTKQTAVALVESLAALCFLHLRDAGNRKNLYITSHGARALETLVLRETHTPRPSTFLEATT